METASDNRRSDMPAHHRQLLVANRRSDRAVGCRLRRRRLDGERLNPHARQGCSASLVTPAVGRPEETKKARYVVALSRVLRSNPGFSRLFALGRLLGHRHVRIWAAAYLRPFAFIFKSQPAPRPSILLAPGHIPATTAGRRLSDWSAVSYRSNHGCDEPAETDQSRPRRFRPS